MLVIVICSFENINNLTNCKCSLYTRKCFYCHALLHNNNSKNIGQLLINIIIHSISSAFHKVSIFLLGLIGALNKISCNIPLPRPGICCSVAISASTLASAFFIPSLRGTERRSNITLFNNGNNCSQCTTGENIYTMSFSRISKSLNTFQSSSSICEK